MKIDVSNIEGYADMTAEEKLKALESYDIPEPDYTGYVKKDVFDKTASELAAKKKELSAKMTEDERKAKESEEKHDELQRKYDALLHESVVSKNKAKLLGLGYAEKLAGETAEAMADGDLEKVFANQKKHLDAFEKQIRAEALKTTPKPTGDGDGKGSMTLENFRKLSPAERHEFSQSHPEEYKSMYTGGNE